MQEFRFKDVELTFNFKKLPSYDQDYLRSMIFEIIKERSVNASGLGFNLYYPQAKNFTLFNNETVKERSVKHSGLGFYNYYPNVDNFTLFNSEKTMLNYMAEFVGEYSYTVSHLLHGKKYWFAWTHNKRK